MIEMFREKCNQCINDFINIYNRNDYINKKTYEKYLEQYTDIFKCIDNGYISKESNMYDKIINILNNGYKIIEKRNQEIIEKKLIEYQDYFDKMFEHIDSNIKLDNEQRKAIISDEDYSLIIAGAGSGKTTTMAAKVKYLIEKKNIDPNRIILIAFTKKAVSELDDLINEKFKLNVKVSTFHSLGLDFIRKISDLPVVTITDADPRFIISRYIKEIVFRDKDLLRELITSFPNYVSFTDEVFKYKTFDEYFSYYIDKKYEECKENLDEYINKTIERRLKYGKTIDGHKVKSKSEAIISNYLYTNGYNYEYEKVYPDFVGINHSYKPDFTVVNGELEVYIEFYGLTEYREFGKYTKEDIDKYNEIISKKREIHYIYGTDCIELFPTDEVIQNLEKELKKRNIQHTCKTKEEIFKMLINTNTESQYYKFLNLMGSFIDIFKSMDYKEDDFGKLISETNDLNLKNQLRFAKKVYNYYNYIIHKEGMIDFNDMINYGYQYMKRVKEKYNNIRYDYLIIDEYQDISRQRYNFVKKITDVFSSKFVAVGDDWQAIYEFSGADINLFTDFYNLMGYADIIRITQTYRNSQELIDIAGTFISKNTNQYLKTLKSNKHDEKPIIIRKYEINKIEELKTQQSYIKELSLILEEIYKDKPDSKILLLGRYNNDIDVVLRSINYKRGVNDRIVYDAIPNLYIDFLTIHASKGLGYDHVILLNAIDKTKGFPSKIKDEPLISLIRPKVEEPVAYPGERRLFYVALTRTKNKVYILLPDKVNLQSEFVNEIIYENKEYIEI